MFKRFRATFEANKVQWSPETAETALRAYNAAETLEADWQSHVERIPKRYVDSVTTELDGTAVLLQTDNLTPGQEEALSSIVGSLETKAAHTQATQRAPKLVEVTVQTVQNNKPTGGFRVHYCPKGWEGVKPKWNEFPTLSTPTIDYLPPGRYLVWTDPDRMEIMNVGGDGKATRYIELLVP